jgi:hypothetical protein
MLDVLKTTKFVVDNSKLVSISTSSVKEFTNTIKLKDLEVSDSSSFHYDWSKAELIKILFIFNSINYCFWAKNGETKWAIEIGEENLTGSLALQRCIEEEMRRNPGFANADNLANLKEEDFEKITKGNVKIPLFNERLECLRELGQGSYETVIDEADGDAIKLVDILVTRFSKFNDVSVFEGKGIGFYKRAQLLAMGISGVVPLYNLDKLTAFADYRIPQFLRRLGIIQYIPELANRIDNYELIEKGSGEEIEIRASTVWVVEKIRQNLSKKFKNITAAQVDMMLWTKSHEKVENEKPYHRTLTTAY